MVSESQPTEADSQIGVADEKQNVTEVEAGTVPVYSADGNITGRVALPPVFSTPIRTDLIKRVVLAVESSRLQPQGRDPLAGKKTTAVSRGVGLGIARVPRVKGSGYSRAGQAAMAPSTVGGRLAHPPKASKKIVKFVNRKERNLALRSALAAAVNREYVEYRGHKVPEDKPLPIVVEDELQNLKHTKSVLAIMKTLGLSEELNRITDGVKVRPGRGKMRGRRYKQRKGPLIIVSEDNGITRAAANIPGVDVALVDMLNAAALAPGTHSGRLTIWSRSALERVRQLKTAA